MPMCGCRRRARRQRRSNANLTAMAVIRPAGVRRREPQVSLHVIVGAGPVGAATATLLAERGEQVRILSRRGIGP